MQHVYRKRRGGMVIAAASALGPAALNSLLPLLLHAAYQQVSYPRPLQGMHAFAAHNAHYLDCRRTHDEADEPFERDLQLALDPTASEELPRELQWGCRGFRKLRVDELRQLMCRLQAAPQHHVILLNLEGHSMGVMMRELAEPIAALKALQVLMLSGKTSPPHPPCICFVLTGAFSHAAGNNIGDSGCTAVARALPHLSALQELHLRGQHVSYFAF